MSESSMRVDMILARDAAGGIGHRGGLPWPRVKWDMDLFRGITRGRTVVMGRRTWESIGRRPLRDRRCIVLSSCLSDLPYSTAALAASWGEVHALTVHDADNPIVMGGADLYRHWVREENADRIDKVWLTQLSGTYKADTFFDFDFEGVMGLSAITNFPPDGNFITYSHADHLDHSETFISYPEPTDGE